jgi:hypothetical protein
MWTVEQMQAMARYRDAKLAELESPNLSHPTPEDILAAWNQALYDVHHPKPPEPVCECGSVTAIENHGLALPGQPNGFYCHRGHRLPGQDMPSVS